MPFIEFFDANMRLCKIEFNCYDDLVQVCIALTKYSGVEVIWINSNGNKFIYKT